MCRRSCGETWRWHSGRVVPELAEHPGAEHDTESWQGEVDVGVRVLFKILGHGVLEVGDLTVQLRDDPDSGFGGGRERLGHSAGGGELPAAQHDLDLGGAPVEVALPATALERGADLVDR